MSEGEWGLLSSDQLLELVGDAIVERNRADARIVALLGYLDRRGVVADKGYPTAAALYADLARVTIGAAKRVAEQARTLHGSVTVTGQPVPGVMPHVAEAFAEGAITDEHVEEIQRFHHSLPADTNPTTWDIAETYLADAARDCTPRGLTRDINELRARLDPDGREPHDTELANPDRELHLAWRGDRLWFNGHLDHEAGLKLEAALSPLAKPRPKAEDGVLDPRSRAERHGDALADLITIAAGGEQLPTEGGEPVTVFVTADIDALRTGIGTATTLDGTTIPVDQVRRIACDANVIPTLLGSHSEILDMGSRERTAPPRLRSRLALRDKGCAHPDCDLPPSRCHAHHIVHWIDHGPTVEKNLVLLCPHHHRQLHHTAWQVRMGPNGHPEFRKPPHLDAIGTWLPSRATRPVPLAA